MRKKLVIDAMFCFLVLACTVVDGADETARYIVSIENTWSEVTHPDAFPDAAHFSWVGGATHNERVSFWDVGEVASPAVVEMAETGVTEMLVQEAMDSVAAGRVYSVIDQRHWFCPEAVEVTSCGPMSFEVEMHADFPLVSLVTMLGPSPDWFVGVSGLALRDDENWIETIQYDLYPYDGGTRSANAFALRGPLNEPPEPITHITHESGQLITEASLGKLTLRRLLACDLNGDFLCSELDVQFITDAVRDQSSEYDLNNDGSMNELDRQYWVERLMGTRFGDANLDGSVDFADFLALSDNFGQLGTWSTGDFDGSGDVGFSDFLTLSDNFGQSNAIAAVPEPSFRPAFLFWFIAISCAQPLRPRRASVTRSRCLLK